MPIMTNTAKVFYIADKLQLFSKGGTLVPPTAFMLLWLPAIYQSYYAWSDPKDNGKDIS